MKIYEVLAFKGQRDFWKWLISWQRLQLWKQLEFLKVWKSQLFITPCRQSCYPTAEPPEGVGWMSPSASRISWVSWQQFLAYEPIKCLPKWAVLINRVWMQKAAVTSNHTSCRPMGTLHCVLHHSCISEKDVLMAPRKWIKVPLDSIASPISKLARRHALQLIMDVWCFLLFYKKQLYNQTSALLFGRSIWLLSPDYS